MKTNQQVKKEFFNRLANSEEISQICSSLGISECVKDMWLRQRNKRLNNRLLLNDKSRVAYIGEYMFHKIVPQATWLSAVNMTSKFDFIYGNLRVEVKAATPNRYRKNGNKEYSFRLQQLEDDKCIIVIFLLPDKCQNIKTEQDIIKMMKNVQALMIPSFRIKKGITVSYYTSSTNKYECYRLENINEINKQIQQILE